MDIKLRNLEKLDKEYFFLWLRDNEVIKYSLSVFQKMESNSEISHWFDKLLLDNSSYNKAIVDDENKKLIGYAGEYHNLMK